MISLIYINFLVIYGDTYDRQTNVNSIYEIMKLLGLISTIAFVYISYAGVTKIAAIAGEVKNPTKNIPLAMIISLLIITVIYVAIAFTLVGNIDIIELSEDIKPIHTLALKF